MRTKWCYFNEMNNLQTQNDLLSLFQTPNSCCYHLLLYWSQRETTSVQYFLNNFSPLVDLISAPKLQFLHQVCKTSLWLTAVTMKAEPCLIKQNCVSDQTWTLCRLWADLNMSNSSQNTCWSWCRGLLNPGLDLSLCLETLGPLPKAALGSIYRILSGDQSQYMFLLASYCSAQGHLL